MDQDELFDVILRTLTEKGHIQAYKSELMYRAVKPLYESRVLERIKVLNGEEKDRSRNLIKLRLLMDLLKKLNLESSWQMLLAEVDPDGEDLETGLENFLKETAENDRQEPVLSALLRIASPAVDNEKDQCPTEEITPSKDPESSQDLFETAIDIKLDEMTIVDRSGDIERLE